MTDLELYIRIDENGDPFEHPIFGDNFREAFPDVDVNNLPPQFAKFVRVLRPVPGVYEVLEPGGPTYQWIDGVVMDVWPPLRAMTESEKTAKQQAAKDAWASLPQRDNFTAWAFNEETCKYEPPFLKPDDGKFYRWHGLSNSWRESELPPRDGKRYTFDFDTWTYIEVPNV